MRCPYHPMQPARMLIPEGVSGDTGWLGWLDGCCRLPVWRCPQGEIHPVEAAYCSSHGCRRPPLGRVAHELAHGPTGQRDLALPSILVRHLDVPPSADGLSSPALAGNVLVYATNDGRLVAVDMGGDRTLVLASGVDSAALRVVGGEVVGATRGEGRLRYLSWSVEDLREALASDSHGLLPTETAATSVHLLGLPRERTRLHQGTGMMRLVVEHDPVGDDEAELYRAVTGSSPGEWLIRRTPNPEGPPVPYSDLRPQELHQVPVPVPGGVFMLGRLRWFGRVVSGALLVPTVAGFVAGGGARV